MSQVHIKGHVKEAEGKLKEVAGKLVGHERLEEKGRSEKIAGERKAAPADLEDDIKKLAGAKRVSDSTLQESRLPLALAPGGSQHSASAETGTPTGLPRWARAQEAGIPLGLAAAYRAAAPCLAERRMIRSLP